MGFFLIFTTCYNFSTRIGLCTHSAIVSCRVSSVCTYFLFAMSDMSVTVTRHSKQPDHVRMLHLPQVTTHDQYECII